MESMVMQNLFEGIYKNKTVLVTGHTGFKGSWLCLWLTKLGANIIGYSLEAPSTPNHIELLNMDMVSIVGDIRDLDNLNATMQKYKPDIVFHLAAQALVRPSYDNPIYTYEVNVMGTLKVLEACKNHNVKAIVNITSDKAYENKEWIWGYRECDPMGGYDPYSSSKGCAELLVSSYRNSFCNLAEYKKTHNTLISSCRAGNVVGGGDWAEDRLIADIMLNTSKGKSAVIRNPRAIRPWQHVLEPLSGYLLIGKKLLEGKKEFAEGWNFGPNDENGITVEQVIMHTKKYWHKIEFATVKDSNQPHEANLLRLDCAKANTLLNWKAIWSSNKTFEMTTVWYKEFYENNRIISEEQLAHYVENAKEKNITWI